MSTHQVSHHADAIHVEITWPGGAKTILDGEGLMLHLTAETSTRMLYADGLLPVADDGVIPAKPHLFTLTVELNDSRSGLRVTDS